MAPRGRWLLIALAAMGTGVALFVVPDLHQTVDIVEPVEPASRVAAVRDSVSELPKHRTLSRQRGELFAPHSWAPPAPPPQPPRPPQPQEAAPQPPPNPYRFAGTVEYGGSRKVLLTRDNRIFEVEEGAMLDPGFRVQSVTANEVTLLYEPLNAPVTVALTFPEAHPAAAAAGPTAAPTAK